MKFHDDFIGSDESNTITNFIGGDADHTFYKNREKQPIDWYYRDVIIEYSFNRWGHRSKNIEDLDLNNYILYTGCSHTQGTGLEENKTYPHQLSKKLNCDYYNLAIPATGIDIIEYNLLLWMARINKPPKLIVLQWPDFSRFTSHNENYLHLLERGTWNTEPEYRKFIASADISGLYNARRAMAWKLIKSVIKVPIITVNINNQAQFDNEPIWLRTIDFARDLSHSGNASNAEFAELIYQKIIKDKYMNV